jgi:hypothetical protein
MNPTILMKFKGLKIIHLENDPFPSLSLDVGWLLREIKQEFKRKKKQKLRKKKGRKPKERENRENIAAHTQLINMLHHQLSITIERYA